MSNYLSLPRIAHVAELRRPVAFWLLAATLSLLLFASSTPSPLYVVYQEQWGFSALTLTGVFSVYALMLLTALLTTGALSDHIGRRPVVLIGLGVELVAMVAFAEAESVGWLFAARALQGVGTGVAMGAISAALLDLQPADKPRLGALLGVIAPMIGLALGALGAGVAVEHGPDPMRFIFWVLLGVFVVIAALTCLVPETIPERTAWRHTLRPRIAVPQHLRVDFVATFPALIATWALGGLTLSLGPSIMAQVMGESNHIVGGLPIVVMAGISAAMGYALRDAPARWTARWGLSALIAGVAIVLLALQQQSAVLFLTGTAVAGLGFGPSYGGVFRALTVRAPMLERGAFVSAILAVSYLAFSLPAVFAGVAVTEFGLRDTAYVYGGALVAIAITALALTRRMPDELDEAV